MLCSKAMLSFHRPNPELRETQLIFCHASNFQSCVHRLGNRAVSAFVGFKF